MVIVRFHQWKEFLGELAAKPPADRLVRLTLSRRYDGRETPHLTLVAGCLDNHTIVEFVEYLGFEPADPEAAGARDIAKLVGERRYELEARGFRVKPGRYHAPPTLGR